jgi:hypothetical protein
MGRPIAVFSNSYARLPERFFARLAPTPATKPRLIKFNESLASELGVNAQGLEPDELAAVFAGNVTPPGAEPIAMAYAGHQFGSFVPQLGDGRAILLGEVLDRSGERRDVQLKGAGRTPFSRRGDGRAALGPVLREYLVSEAMHALGIPTTRALAAVSTGERVYRDRQLPEAVLTRVASSHIRVGTFQYFAARGDQEAVERLSDYVIDRHFPEARDAERPRLALLQAVLERQALLIARWMHVGFIHGVMNTDNTALSGETIDFGPCAFMDSYDPATTFSAIDEFGRYAYAFVSDAHPRQFDDPLPLAISPDHCPFRPSWMTQCLWRSAALAALERAGRRYKIVSTSSDSAAWYAAAQAGLAVTVSLPEEVPDGLQSPGSSPSPCSQRALSASACSRSPCSPPLAPTRLAKRSAGPPVSTANRSTPRHSTSRSRFQPSSASASTSSASIQSRPCSGRR